jgi:hypothetical protein
MMVAALVVAVGGATYVNWSPLLVVLVTPAVVTVISTAPAEPAGETAVICVAELTVKLVVLVEPNFTAVAPVKFVPVIVTVVPPTIEPDVGETPEMVGTAVNVIFNLNFPYLLSVSNMM